MAHSFFKLSAKSVMCSSIVHWIWLETSRTQWGFSGSNYGLNGLLVCHGNVTVGLVKLIRNQIFFRPRTVWVRIFRFKLRTSQDLISNRWACSDHMSSALSFCIRRLHGKTANRPKRTYPTWRVISGRKTDWVCNTFGSCLLNTQTKLIKNVEIAEGQLNLRLNGFSMGLFSCKSYVIKKETTVYCVQIFAIQKVKIGSSLFATAVRHWRTARLP